MKKIILLSTIFCYGFISAQIKTPQPSPTATIIQKVGVSDISVEYSRPGAKGREIFGDLVPYGKMWRTGANKATKITFNEDCIFGGIKIKKGSYSLFTIPDMNVWSVLLNNDTELWGVGDYDKKKQVCNIETKVINSKDFTESFTIEFGKFKSFSSTMSLKWANTQIDIVIESKSSKEKILKDYKELLNNGPSANDYYNGAKFVADNARDYEAALEWINIAIEKRKDAFWMMYHKARILSLIGNEEEAVYLAINTIKMASKKEDDYGYIKRCKKLISDIKSGKSKLEEK